MRVRFGIFAMVLIGIVVFGCNDGKFNLVLYIPEWMEDEPQSSASVARSSSNIPAVVISSSSKQENPLSSSEEEPLSSSFTPNSSSSLSSSSEIPLSSSGFPPRYSSSRGFEDYPILEPGAPGVKKGVTTRYWDGCKATCSWPFNLPATTLSKEPLSICRACDRYGTTEIPLIYKHTRSNEWGTYYTSTPNPGAPDAPETWFNSETYTAWKANYPAAADRSLAYTCFDMTPHAVNDTLAYGFAAFGGDGSDEDEINGTCGKCYQLYFVSDEWRFGNPRVTHRALRGKTMIIMSNNTGTVGKNHFDIMIPGGGMGAFDCFSEQFGLTKGDPNMIFGHNQGGLLDECVFPDAEDSQKYGQPSDRYSLDTWKRCMRDKCERAFGSQTGRPKELLDGCLWHAEWFMAADNPEVYYVETTCPKYLLDKYNSKLTTSLPKDGQLDGMH